MTQDTQEHKPVRAVLFDVDGTLVDTNDLHTGAWRETFLHFGHDLPVDAIRWQMGKGGDNLIPSLLPDLGEDAVDEIDAYRSALYKRDYLPRAVPFAGVRDLFARLYADGIRIVLASSANADELAYNLDLIGAADLVQAETSRDEAEHSKPSPDIFAAAMRKVAPLETDDVIVVGDTPWDAKAAAKLGLRTIGFRSGGFPDDALREGGATILYDGPADLLAQYDRSVFAHG